MSIEDIKVRLTQFNNTSRIQGDFHIYASLYCQDVELLLGMLAPATEPKTETIPLVVDGEETTAVRRRRKKK